MYGTYKVRQLARTDTDALLRDGLQNMQSYLADRGWAGGSDKPLPPCVMAYFITCLKSALGDRLSDRSAHEMQTVAEALDHILRGQFSQGMSVLIQRFKCLEVVARDRTFDHARHFELV